MFTGLIEAVGTIVGLGGDSPRRLSIASSIPAHEMAMGDSVAIDGCCLTVVEIATHAQGSLLQFEAATESLQRTTLGSVRIGGSVHLERALALGGRLGGHLVSGHVDGVGTVRVKERRGSAVYFGIEAPPEVARLSVARGSITLAGISLTVTDVQGHIVSVGVIPHTLGVTTMGDFGVGTLVNMEADLIARYVARLLPGAERHSPEDSGFTGQSLTVQYLKDRGFA